ncbi:MAG: sulfatase [Bacteroidota bacterium]
MIARFLLLTLAVCLGCQTSAPTEKRPPNIVLIFTDDQGYQDVGVFGSPNIETPHLDQMAAEGARFTQFYAAQPVCSASRAALLTGCYPNRIGIHGALFPKAKTGLNLQETTIAEMLKPLGYATAIFGKWHLGDHPDLLPTKHGFDEYFGIPFSNDMWPYHENQDHFNFDPLILYDGDSVKQHLDDQSMLTTWITERAVDFIERKKEQPFFLYVPHPMPHIPLYVSDKFKGKSERGLYGDVISEIDWSVGQILASLKENGLDDNTLVIFTSDNGPWLQFGTHSGSALPLREGKGTCWEGGIREACIMRWPGMIPAQQQIDQAAMTIDVLPTIASLTGAALPNVQLDGHNIWPMMQGNQMEPRPEGFGFYYHHNELHAVLSGDGRWKLYLPHRYRTLNGGPGGSGGTSVPYDYINLEASELYDLQKDISEENNIIAEHPEIVDSLSQLAAAWRSRLGDKLQDVKGAENRKPARVSWE